ncbi:MAG: RNA methyltransferase [Anaerolineae bacterium]|nr:RNA methyltransferase [Anaerolineae bacterium]
MSEIITSVHNPRVKHAAGLREKKQRELDGLMLVDGAEEVSLALASRAVMRTLFCSEHNRDDAYGLLAKARQAGAEVIHVGGRAFEKVAYRDSPDGWVGVFHKPSTALAELRLGVAPLVLVIEAVEKPGNLGAMLRTADAAGADAVISCNPITDLSNPNVVRASKGAVFAVPIAEASTAETLRWLRRHHIKLVAATPAATQSYADVDWRQPIALAVGEEKHGLSDELLTAADISVRIPMRGRVNSLNVSNSAAILLYEAVRQRG